MPIYSIKGISPMVDKSAFIHPDAVVIGNVRIGPDSSLWPGVVVRGDVNKIRIGARTNIQDGAILHVTRISTSDPKGCPLIIGNDVTIAHGVILHGCRLENRSMISMGAIIMDNVVVEEEAMVGAGALVTPGKQISGGMLWMGSPARFIRPLKPNEMKGFQRHAKNYVRLARDSMSTMKNM